MKKETRSEIWRMVSERVGSIQSFHSERDMESFLLNHPAVLGAPNIDFIRSQVYIKRGDKDGRMDIVALAQDDKENWILRIFELKVSEIDKNAVEQINWYLEGLRLEPVVKKELKSWIASLEQVDLPESKIDELIEHPSGVLVGPRFEGIALKELLDKNIQGVRLARFHGREKSEYYVIIEDQIGKIVSAPRRYFSWQQLIDRNLIDKDDLFILSHESIKLEVKPDPQVLNYFWIGVVFEKDSARMLQEKRAIILENAKNKKLKWANKTIDYVGSGHGVWLSLATGLSYLAFGWPEVYWTPTFLWIHEKTGKSLYQLRDDFVKLEAKNNPNRD